MTTVTAYTTAYEYMNITENFLEQKELENNLILGLCNNLVDKRKIYENCIFINSFENNEIQATSIKLTSKAVVSAITKKDEHIKALADYYINKQVELPGVVGESFYSYKFSKFYGKHQVGEKTMVVHKLESVNKLAITTGRLEKAIEKDIELITEWTLNMEEEMKTFPKQSREQVFISTQTRVGLGNIFKWIDKSEIVSIAAIVRKTKNIGIVGLVYTPYKFRGNGYAKSTVHTLGEHILQSGFKYCGLFTDKSNPTSNHIYQNIGYIPITEFTDIEYELIN